MKKCEICGRRMWFFQKLVIELAPLEIPEGLEPNEIGQLGNVGSTPVSHFKCYEKEKKKDD